MIVEDYLPIFPYQSNNTARNLFTHLYTINKTVVPYTLVTVPNELPGVTYDPLWRVDVASFAQIETFPATIGNGTYTLNYVQSVDGNFYTVLGSQSKLSHVPTPDQAKVSWDFMKQFSRDSDGSINVATAP